MRDSVLDCKWSSVVSLVVVCVVINDVLEVFVVAVVSVLLPLVDTVVAFRETKTSRHTTNHKDHENCSIQILIVVFFAI